MPCTITMMIPLFFTVTPNLQLTLMTGLQFEQYFDKIEKVDKEGFNETLVVEVRTQDKKAILAAAKAEADKAREPPQVYREEVVEEPPSSGKGRGKRKRLPPPKPKTRSVFGE